MVQSVQSANMRGEIMNPDISRIALRKYPDLIDDALAMKGWTKTDLAKSAAAEFPDLDITAEKVYEFLERPRDARAAFAKAIEWTLGINLPPQCYWNAGKK